MKRAMILAALVAGPLLALAQQPAPNAGHQNGVMPGTGPRFQPAVPAGNTQVYGGGGYGGWGGGGQTPQGAYLQGMSQVISAAGEAHLANSAAAINLTEADSNAMRNRVQGVQTFWAMRDIGREERARERGPAPTPEELARRARAGAPSQLTTAQIDPVTGELRWPSALQQAMFADQRAPVEECAAKWVKYGTLDYNDQTTVRQNIDAMFDGIKSQIASIPPQDYVACRKFLQSLLYATTQTTF